jgi:hypothetical protein
VSVLSEQPPPRKGARPGYYPDPLGSGRARWWDGSAWTLRVGAQVPPGAAAGKPVPPPKRLCGRCGVQSETFGDTCLNCGRPYGANRALIAVAIVGACIAVIALLGGCAALIAVGIEAAEDELDENAITRQQFQEIEPGASEASVRARLGEPSSEEELGRPRVNCIYDSQEGEGLSGLDDFQLCFAGGVLSSKSID